MFKKGGFPFFLTFSAIFLPLVKQLNYFIMSKISIHDFGFKFLSAGHYKVRYTSPVTGRSWAAHVFHMPLIDATLNAEEPKRKDLESLKWYCKNLGLKVL